jgi:hypothetical protein
MISIRTTYRHQLGIWGKGSLKIRERNPGEERRNGKKRRNGKTSDEMSKALEKAL